MEEAEFGLDLGRTCFRCEEHPEQEVGADCLDYCDGGEVSNVHMIDEIYPAAAIFQDVLYP